MKRYVCILCHTTSVLLSKIQLCLVAVGLMVPSRLEYPLGLQLGFRHTISTTMLDYIHQRPNPRYFPQWKSIIRTGGSHGTPGPGHISHSVGGREYVWDSSGHL